MNDSIERAALAAAERLAAEHGPRLKTDVLAELHNGGKRPDQYIEPISIASLIVSIASLAYTVYKDQRTKNKEVIARRIRLELSPVDDTRKRDQIIDIVIDDITNPGNDEPPQVP